jgi:STE24 endopeptidase
MPADARDFFDPDEIERGRAYARPAERMGRVRLVLTLTVSVAFVVGEAGPRLVDALDPPGWALQVVAVAVAFTLADLVVTPWFDAWRELVHDERHELSNQTVAGFLRDQVLGTAVGVVTTLVLVVPLWAVVRATDLWWLWGWLLFSGFTVLFGLLYPIVIAPLFNTFVPMEAGPLRERLLGVAAEAGLDVNDVLVADASKRSRAGNAYVAGLGRTRRVVVFDTILGWPAEVIEQVVAHELGHWAHKHLRRKLPVLIGLQLLLFVGTWAVLRWDWLLDLAGVDSVEDPAALPLFLLVFPVGFVLANLGTSWLSRADERQADLYALDLLDDPRAFDQVFRRLAETNKADVDPSTWKRANASHPPIAERLELARRWSETPPD